MFGFWMMFFGRNWDSWRAFMILLCRSKQKLFLLCSWFSGNLSIRRLCQLRHLKFLNFDMLIPFPLIQFDLCIHQPCRRILLLAFLFGSPHNLLGLFLSSFRRGFIIGFLGVLLVYCGGGNWMWLMCSARSRSLMIRHSGMRPRIPLWPVVLF